MSGNLAELVGIDVPTRLLIGGEWTGGHGGGTLPVIDPATEDELAQAADGTEQHALDAVAADLDAAVEGALVAKMRNGGEACTAANRFYVHEAVAEEFSRKFSARLDAMVVGPGLDESTEIGPLVNEPTRTKVAGLVESAATDGGKVVTGGRAPDRRGYYYQPTMIDQVPSGAGILSTEIFGPVAPIVRFTAEDDAVRRWANDTEFGLVSYVYTRDLGRGLRVSEALDAGMVGLNRGIVSDPAAPFGGVKQSGLGREGAHDGLLETPRRNTSRPIGDSGYDAKPISSGSHGCPAY